MKKNYIVIPTVVAFVGFFAAAATFYNKQKGEELTSASQENLEYLLRDYSPRMGPENAKVTIVEFFDPACGTCNAFYPLVKQIMKENPGQVNLVLRYLPFHKNSDVIVSIFEGARIQGRFRQTLELAYKTSDLWIENHVAIPERFWAQLGLL